MHSESELQALIAAARFMGYTVELTYDEEARSKEGRDIIETVQVSGLKGFGPGAMSALYFVEKMRGIMAAQPQELRSWVRIADFANQHHRPRPCIITTAGVTIYSGFFGSDEIEENTVRSATAARNVLGC